MRGRKPKLRLVETSPPANACPRAPDWLTPVAAAEWRRVAPQLHIRRALTPDTLTTLAAYCLAAGQVRELEGIMRAEGRILQSATGPIPHPAHRMQLAAIREARLLATELAMTPHRRRGADVPSQNDDAGWSDLLA